MEPADLSGDDEDGAVVEAVPKPRMHRARIARPPLGCPVRGIAIEHMFD
jgi:hypothetical protein